MKFLWGDTRFGMMNRRRFCREGVRAGRLTVHEQDVDTFRLWGVVFGMKFLGFMTRTKNK